MENRPDKDEETLPDSLLRQKLNSIEQHILSLAPLQRPYQSKDALSLCIARKGKRLRVLFGGIGNAVGQYPCKIAGLVSKQVLPTPRTDGINLDIGKQMFGHALRKITVIDFFRLMQPP